MRRQAGVGRASPGLVVPLVTSAKGVESEVRQLVQPCSVMCLLFCGNTRFILFSAWQPSYWKTLTPTLWLLCSLLNTFLMPSIVWPLIIGIFLLALETSEIMQPGSAELRSDFISVDIPFCSLEELRTVKKGRLPYLELGNFLCLS